MNVQCLLSTVFLSSSLALAYPVTKSVPLSPSISAEMAKTNNSFMIMASVPITSSNVKSSVYAYFVYSPNQPLADTSTSSERIFTTYTDNSPFYLINSASFESAYKDDYLEWAKIRFDFSLSQDKETLKFNYSYSLLIDSINSTSNSSWNFVAYSNNVFGYYNVGTKFLNNYNLLYSYSGSSTAVPSTMSGSTSCNLTFAKYSVNNNQAYNQGKTDGMAIGYKQGYQNGKEDGYAEGYKQGTNDDFTNSALVNLFDSILKAPFTLLSEGLNFELFGINFGSLTFSIVTIALVALVISFLIGKFK